MFSLVDLGLNTAIMHSLYKPLADNDHCRLQQIMTLYKKTYYFIALFFCIVGLIFTPFLRMIVSQESQIPYLELYYILLVFTVSCSYLFTYNGLLISADQKGYINSKMAIWGNIIFSIFNIIGLYLFKSYFFFLLINLLAT